MGFLRGPARPFQDDAPTVRFCAELMLICNAASVCFPPFVALARGATRAEVGLPAALDKEQPPSAQELVRPMMATLVTSSSSNPNNTVANRYRASFRVRHG